MEPIDYNKEENCVFCKIAAGTIPAQIFYQDDGFLGFLDIHPASKGHTLLIPKKHIRWVHDVEPFGEYWEIARKIMRQQEAILNPQWVQYLTHGGVTHAHIHIIPRYDNIDTGPALLPQPNKPAASDQLNELAHKLMMS